MFSATSPVDVLKILAPGHAPFFVAAAGTSAILIGRGGRSRRVGGGLAILLALTYVGLALPWTAGRIASGLVMISRVHDPSDTRGAAIVVLSGDSQHARVVEALRLNALVAPPWIVVSGSELIREELIDGGVPREHITMEMAGRTTREQAMNAAQLVRSRGIGRVVLVASAIHLPRAAAAFRAVGLEVVPSASATRSIAGLPRFWPAYNALRLSRESIYEYAALRYYGWRGWLPVPASSTS